MLMRKCTNPNATKKRSGEDDALLVELDSVGDGKGLVAVGDIVCVDVMTIALNEEREFQGDGWFKSLTPPSWKFQTGPLSRYQRKIREWVSPQHLTIVPFLSPFSVKEIDGKKGGGGW